jgi:hypothetical protein
VKYGTIKLFDGMKFPALLQIIRFGKGSGMRSERDRDDFGSI